MISKSAPERQPYADGEKRHPSANRFYWGALVTPIAAALGVAPDEAHAFLKTEFNAVRLVVGDRELRRAVSTKDLNPAEFYRYVAEVKKFAIKELGIQVVAPWKESRGRH